MIAAALKKDIPPSKSFTEIEVDLWNIFHPKLRSRESTTARVAASAGICNAWLIESGKKYFVLNIEPLKIESLQYIEKVQKFALFSFLCVYSARVASFD